MIHTREELRIPSYKNTNITFRLDDDFIAGYVDKSPDWGPVGLVVYTRTYARKIDDLFPRYQELAKKFGITSNLEKWWLTIARVVEGTYRAQEKHCRHLHIPWDPKKAQRSAQEMYSRIFAMKFLPPGRGLWMMGTKFVEERGAMPLNNCAFTSTMNIKDSFSAPFTSAMDMLMLGVGVGFDTKGAGKIKLQNPAKSNDVHVVSDTREGWINLLQRLLDSYVGNDAFPASIDYSNIRKAGEPIKGFGGTSSGAQPLRELVTGVIEVLERRFISGNPVTVTDIVDIFNLIGRCVVAGNVRRSAELALSNPTEEYLALKNPEVNKERFLHHGWASNNSVFSYQGMDYSLCAEKTANNGEPGYFWLDNARKYGRFKDRPDWKDKKACGVNPCQPESALVLAEKGIRTFGDISVGDVIWSGKRWTVVTNKWCTGKKNVYKYSTSAGYFLGTENHKVFQKGQRIEVRNADTIDLSTCVLPIDSIMHNTKDVLAGLLIGDGGNNTGSERSKVLLYVGENDQDYFTSEIADLLDRPAGEDEKAWYLSEDLFDRLPPLKERNIPDKYFYSKPNSVASFLRGLYSANGSVVGHGRVTLKSVNFDLISRAQVMLSSLGIRSYYTKNKPKKVKFSNGSYVCSESYDLNISTDRDLFYKYIGFIQKYKNYKLEKWLGRSGKPKTSYPISSIEYVSTEDVYDITVEAEEHSYWTAGLLVSNCSEQILEDQEVCCLVESFPARHEDYEDYKRTLKFAYLYAKTVTLMPTHNARVNSVVMRNRRIGCSMSGVVQAANKFGRRELFNMCDSGYEYIKDLDNIYSSWLCVPRSIRRTSIKPSGTVSKLNGSTPGVHYPHSKYYYQVIRFMSDSPMVAKLKKAGYPCYDLSPNEPNTTGVYFPVKEDHFERGKSEVSMWEQLELAAQMQYYWSDNSVSVTVTFGKKESKDIKYALELYESRLKSVSFLPSIDHGYDHAPYQEISEGEYYEAIKGITPLESFDDAENEVIEKFCDGDSCTI